MVNEFSTIASVWTAAQFLTGETLSGKSLGLRIAAGNVPNFVDLETGGYGGTIQDALNGGQTPTMANFATLANLLAGCITQVTPGACQKFFAQPRPRKAVCRQTHWKPPCPSRGIRGTAGKNLRLVERILSSATG
jgi:hypothetical protein